MTEAWVSMDAVAEHLGVTRDRIHRWIEQRRLPAHRIGKLWKFKLSQVDAWVVSGGAGETPVGGDGHPGPAAGAPADVPRADDHLHAISEVIEDGLLVLDAGGNVIAMNEVESRLWGFGAAAQLPQNLTTLATLFEVHTLDGAVVPVEQWPASRVLRGERIRGVELSLRRKDTGRGWLVRFTGQPVLDADGRVVLAVLVGRDVTAAAERERTLRANERWLNLALQLAQAGTFEIDVSGHEPPIVTDGLRRLYGFADDQRPSLAEFVDRIHPDDRARAAGTLGELMKGEGASARYIEYRIGGDDRPTIFVAARVVRVHERNAPRLMGVVLDITDRIQTEAALRTSAERFRALADAMPQLVWVANSAGIVEYYNARSHEYAGIEERDDGTWGWQPVVHDEDLDATLQAWNAAVSSSAPYSCEHRVRMADGSYRWHISRAYLVGSGADGRWFGTATDIHAQKLAEEELRRAVVARDQVLSVVAHDLRNPLGVIRTSAPLVVSALRGNEGEPLRRAQAAAARIERHVTSMEKLIDELVDLGTLQAGQPLTLERRPFDLLPVLRDVISAHDRPGVRPVQLRTSAAALVGDWDAGRLERVVHNLITNAIKYSAPGTEVTVEAESVDACAVVRVRDRGIGIAEQDRDRIFQWFARGTNAGATRGSGIGLAGARQIAEQHGGSLTVESTLGQGSVFTLRIPLRSAPQPEGREPGGPSRSTGRSP